MGSKELNAIFRLEFLKKKDKWKLSRAKEPKPIVKTSSDTNPAEQTILDEGESSLLNKAFQETEVVHTAAPETPEDNIPPEAQETQIAQPETDLPLPVTTRVYIWQLPEINNNIEQNHPTVNDEDQESCSLIGRCAFVQTQYLAPQVLIPEAILSPTHNEVLYNKILERAAEQLKSHQTTAGNCNEVHDSSSSSFDSFLLGAEKAHHSTAIDVDAGSVASEFEYTGEQQTPQTSQTPQMPHLMQEAARLISELTHALMLARQDAQPPVPGSQLNDLPMTYPGPATTSTWGQELLSNTLLTLDSPGRGRGRLHPASGPRQESPFPTRGYK